MPRTAAQKFMGVVKRPEDKFKKKELIKFLASLGTGFIDERIYLGSFYATKKGMPDVFFYHHGQTYAFETKCGTKLSTVQKMQHKNLELAGVFVFVVTPLNFQAIKQTMWERTK